ncbi:MAG TPA: hypothetical protein VGE01_04930 [Fimbriimonas sp.]
MDAHFGDEPRALVFGDWYTAALIRRELESRRWVVKVASALKEIEPLLAADDFDLLVVEWRLPAFNAYHSINHVRTELGYEDLKLLVVSEGIGIETEMKLKVFGHVGFMHIPFCGLDFDCFANWHHHQSLPQRRPVAGANVPPAPVALEDPAA